MAKSKQGQGSNEGASGAPSSPGAGRAPSAAEASKALKEQAARVSDSDLESVLGKEEKIRALISKGPLSKLVKDIQLLFSLMRAYWKGDYRQIPWFSIAAIVSAFLYVLNPLDLIPDIIPIIGHLDDAAVVAACLAMVREDLARYEAWQNK